MVYFEGSRIVYNGNKRRTKFKEMEREKMNLSKIHHIAIIVSNYEAAKDFYVNEYNGAAEPPVRCGESHLSGLTEPPQFVY